jgi:hypothetical protein
MSKVITTDKCEGCNHCNINESDKARIIVKCDLHDKEYMYGQKIVCGKDD